MRIFLSALISVLLLARCGGSGSDPNKFEEVSKVRFPEGFQVTEQYDNGKETAAFLIVIPKEKIEAFSKQYSFQPIDSMFVSRSFGGNHILHQENKAPAFDSKFRVVSGCSDHRHWVMYLDPQSGKVWCLLEYPDKSGATPC